MKKILKHSAIFLLLFLCLMVTGTTLLFITKISITRFHLIIFLILSGVIYYFISKKELEKKSFIKMLSLSLIVIVLSTVISTFMFDRSSDGNTYHKDAIGVLKEGFNPVYEESDKFILKRDNSKQLTNYAVWTDHYAKANWIMAANFYSLTGNIESGKAMNLISLYIVFVLLLVNLTKVLSKKKSLILSLLIVFNPIVSSQIFTYYNDQLVCLYLFLSILMLIKIDFDFKNKENWLIYILTFILLANTKFNGMGYLLVFSFFFVCKYLYSAYKKKEFLSLFKKLCIIFIPLFIFSFGVVGSHTYLKNTIDHKNPFFPLYDKNGEDIITEQEPKSFLKMNNVSKWFYGTFSKANNLRENDNTTLKIPFTVYKSELKPAMSNDLRISGWGILFSGLFILSIIVLITKYKNYKKETYILYSLGITCLLVVVMSESWWARYNPYFYLFVIFGMYIMLKYNKNRIINALFGLLIAINSLIPLLGNTYYTFTNSIKIRKDFKKLENKKIIIIDKKYNGIYYNLKDYNIKFSFGDQADKEMYYHYINYKNSK